MSIRARVAAPSVELSRWPRTIAPCRSILKSSVTIADEFRSGPTIVRPMADGMREQADEWMELGNAVGFAAHVSKVACSAEATTLTAIAATVPRIALGPI